MTQTNAPAPNQDPFHVRDCALVAQSAGYKAQTLAEFHDALMMVDAASIYHHFWGRFLEPRFDEPEYNNDFASWVHRALHEKALAEKLSMVTPTAYDTIEEIREEVVDRVAEQIDLYEYMPWAKADQKFYFLRSQIVVFDTGVYLNHPADLLSVINEIPLGSIFYHFIDSRRRTQGCCDDFSAWLQGWGEEFAQIRNQLMAIDPFFSSLSELRSRVAQLLKNELAEVPHE